MTQANIGTYFPLLHTKYYKIQVFPKLLIIFMLAAFILAEVDLTHSLWFCLF